MQRVAGYAELSANPCALVATGRGLICSSAGYELGKTMTVRAKYLVRGNLEFLFLLADLLTPQLAHAQASPFLTGATSLESNILAWLTPIAIILVMVLGAMAMANRISWAWCIAAILGIAIAFGAPQIVTWVRGMFGV